VVVAGGGLAGIAAALRAADAGCRVTLVEARPRLGGAAFSFRRGELSVDNGQHVFLRCCEAYRWFLDRVGATDRTVLQPRLDIPVFEPGGRSAHLSRTPGVPAPGHLTAALATYRLLSPADRFRAARGALALRMLDPADRSLDSQTLGDFLRRHGQSRAVIDRLWGVVAVATLNLHPDDASLALAAKVFRTGLLDHAPAADVGYAAAPLGELHDVAARRALDTAGVEVLLQHRVEDVDGGPVLRVRSRDGVRELRPDAAVLAVPPRDLFRVAPRVSDGPAAVSRELGTAPIVNVHVIYDRKVTDVPFAAAVGSPVHWFFDRTDTSGLRATHPRAQYLAITVSAADDIVDTPSRELQERFVDALAQLLPQAARAEVVDSFVTRERNATFRQSAGTARLRATGDSGLAGVRLAGAWTATGWPDTMESAVRSGVAGAEATLTALGVRAPDALEFAA
jgi:squalene-associated FAD-dependent desaturase